MAVTGKYAVLVVSFFILIVAISNFLLTRYHESNRGVIETNRSEILSRPSLLNDLGLKKDLTNKLKRKWLDVPYGNYSESQKLDIYLPEKGIGPYPVIVSIHGGGFYTGDKNGYDLEAAIAGLARGYAVVSVNYRLSSEAIYPAQIFDVKAAIRFIKANAMTYSLDPGKIGVWGSSAGGYLAAMVGTSGGVEKLEDLEMGNSEQSSRVGAVVDWYGPMNFLTIDSQFRALQIDAVKHNDDKSFESLYLGANITKVPRLVIEANPETYITKDDPPFFIQHGRNDNVVPISQSVLLSEKLIKVLGRERVNLGILSNANHSDPEFHSQNNIDMVMDFFDKYLK